jgi:adenylate cyclase
MFVFSKTLIASLHQWQSLLLAPLSISALTITINSIGIIQPLEWTVLDQLFLLRQPEAIEDRIVVIEADEASISSSNQWPLSDAKLAELIRTLSRQKPAAIGLDLYRNVPVSPGESDWVEVQRTTPNLIGIEKHIGAAVPPSSILEAQGQVALADLVLDTDNRVRRGLLSIETADREVRLGLGTRLAIDYLDQRQVAIQQLPGGEMKIGRALFWPLDHNPGIYHRDNIGGYQILLNYRGARDRFHHYSLQQVLNQQLPAGVLTGKIVMVGVTAQSLNDVFLTPFNRDFFKRAQAMPGIYIHANLTSQILSAAIDDRPLIHFLSGPMEWLWILGWSGLGTGLGWGLMRQNRLKALLSPGWLIVAGSVAGCGVLLLTSYGCFLGGWFMPTGAPLIALTLAVSVAAGYYNQRVEHLASIDALTLVANRGCFNQTLQRWLNHDDVVVSMILCDVDFFKPYNDTYGHQAGDTCLRQVAKAMRGAVRNVDVVARYGGEEFAVILPNTPTAIALDIAERVRASISDLNLPHSGSKVCDHVTLSCGVSTLNLGLPRSAEALIKAADLALYQSKSSGRNRVSILSEPGAEPEAKPGSEPGANLDSSISNIPSQKPAVAVQSIVNSESLLSPPGTLKTEGPLRSETL